MSQSLSSTSQKYQIIPIATGIPRVNKNDFIERGYTVFAFSSALILVMLGLRALLALFVVTSPLLRGLSVVTSPFVAPFAHIFHDAHSMIQASTATAFTFYYAVYWIVALVSHFIRQTRLESY
jgi:hypothetical protein